MSFLKQIFQPCSPRLTHPTHYLDVLERNPGRLQELFLEDTAREGPFLHLTYTYIEALSHSQADVVDTRLRAYIACAIFDACRGFLSCRPGPSYGIRPSWFVESCRVPVSLVQGRYDVDNQSIYLTVGPVVFGPAIRSAEASEYALAIETGFIQRFSRVKV